MRISLCAFTILAFITLAHAVTFVSINQKEMIEVNSLPVYVTVCFDVASIGNKAECEIYHDINCNNRIDFDEPRVFYHAFVDGLGTICSGETKADAIIGDETQADGFIKASLFFDESWNPGCRQKWILKITDGNGSVATSLMEWNLPKGRSGVFGKVSDESGGKPQAGVVLQFVSESVPPACYRAVTDQNGCYSISLPPGDYCVDLNAECRNTPGRLRVEGFSELNLAVKPYDTFIIGKTMLQNGMPVSGITVVVQNKDNRQIFQSVTNEKGEFTIGIEPGEYIAYVNQLFNNHNAIPQSGDIRLVQPEQTTFYAEKGVTIAKNFIFPILSQPTRKSFADNSTPQSADLVPAVYWHSSTNLKRAYQASFASYGSDRAANDDASFLKLVAQQSGTFSPATHPYQIPNDEHHALNDFDLDAEEYFMHISGKVIDERGKPVSGAWIVARHAWDNSPAAHLITRSNDQGEYYFNLSLEGDWRIGVYSQAKNSSPNLYFRYATKGVHHQHLDFVLNRGKLLLAGDELLSEPTPLSILPKTTSYRSKPNAFSFSGEASDKVDEPSLDDKGLVKLIDSQMSRGFQQSLWDLQENRLIMDRVDLSRIASEEKAGIYPENEK